MAEEQLDRLVDGDVSDIAGPDVAAETATHQTEGRVADRGRATVAITIRCYGGTATTTANNEG